MTGRPKKLAATILDIREYADDVKWFRLGLSEPMNFVPGQFIDLRFPGETRYHAFSIASSPKAASEVELIVKKEKEFTTRLFEQTAGAQLESVGPMGQFMHDLDSDIVTIAGGVGITPFLSLLRWVRDYGIRDRQFWLFLSNRTRNRIVCEQELRELDTLENVHVVLTLTREEPDGWDGELGHFDKDTLLTHLSSFAGKTFYTCGPGRMVDAIVKLLTDAGVPNEKVRHESWG